jgi:hypothetical protein
VIPQVNNQMVPQVNHQMVPQANNPVILSIETKSFFKIKNHLLYSGIFSLICFILIYVYSVIKNCRCTCGS